MRYGKAKDHFCSTLTKDCVYRAEQATDSCVRVVDDSGKLWWCDKDVFVEAAPSDWLHDATRLSRLASYQRQCQKGVQS